ncbi:MAG: hypothetical protein KIT83_10555 [Bryobacterales bacterium]|nr:hypothetical protein [Bryobacterales bacterium]
MSIRINYGIAITLFFCFVLAMPDASGQVRSRVTASTMDSDGNTYVTGWRVTEEGPGGTYVADIATIKYDKLGSMVWIHRYPENSGFVEDQIRDAEGWGIASDRWGNVYVAGHIGGPGNVDALLIKYPSNYAQGQQPAWVKTFAGNGNGNDQFWHLTLDPDGNIYATGYARLLRQNTGLLDNDFLTIKYDPNGNVLWQAFSNGPAGSGDVAVAVAVDPQRRNVFVTGFTSIPNGTDLWTVMYNASGVEQWARVYNGPVGGYSRGTSLAVDNAGSVYVTGWSQGAGTNNLDYATLKYNMEGNELWAARYDGPAGANDQPAPPVIWGVTQVAAIGSYLQTNQGIVLAEEVIDPVPAISYLKDRVNMTTLPHGPRNSLLVKLTNCEKSLLAANAATRRDAPRHMDAFLREVMALRMSLMLDEVTTETLAEIATHIRDSIKGVPAPVVYMFGQSTGVGTNIDFALVKYHAKTGRSMWYLPGQPGATEEKPGSPAHIALRYNGPANNIDRGWSAAINEDGNLFVTGPSMAVPSSSVDYFLVKYHVNSYRPMMLAEARYNGPMNAIEQPTVITTWQDPDTGRYQILRDPVTKQDFVGISGASAQLPAYSVQYTTIMYNGNLEQQWLQTIFD